MEDFEAASAQTEKVSELLLSPENTKGYSTGHLTRAMDVMPLDSSLKLDMEVWSWTDCEMEYAVEVYWYGDADAETKSNR